jgi:hypothetical protein
VGQDGGLIGVFSPRVPGKSENNHEKTSLWIADVPAKIRRFEDSTSEVQNITGTLGITFITKGEFHILLLYHVIQFIKRNTKTYFGRQ